MLDPIKENGLRIELNPHFAVNTNKLEDIYPEPYIVERALDKGILFSYGSDAHMPESVGTLSNELEKHPIYCRAFNTWE